MHKDRIPIYNLFKRYYIKNRELWEIRNKKKKMKNKNIKTAKKIIFLLLINSFRNLNRFNIYINLINFIFNKSIILLFNFFSKLILKV